jgi:hypothetical protein
MYGVKEEEKKEHDRGRTRRHVRIHGVDGVLWRRRRKDYR